MARFRPNPRFLNEVQRRSAVAAAAAGEHYLREMAETLSNSPARTGKAYEKRRGRIQAIPSIRAQTDGGEFFGREYRQRSIRIHIASAPGEPPALLFGDLRRRRAMRMGRTSDGEVATQFGSNVPYAERMEKGGEDKRGVNIEARPAWGPTLRGAWPQIMRTYTGVMRQQLGVSRGA